MNEGKLPPEVPVEKLKTEHLSKPRNTLLADVFYKAGFIESWGRGTIKIMEKCQEQGLPEPDFEEEYGVMKVVFYKDKLVMYVKEKKSINLSSFKTIVSEVSEKTLYRDLQELVSKGILKELGEKKGRKYELL